MVPTVHIQEDTVEAQKQAVQAAKAHLIFPAYRVRAQELQEIGSIMKSMTMEEE